MQVFQNEESAFYLHADMAELADALDLGSSVHDVQVQVLLSAFTETLLVAGGVFFVPKYAREADCVKCCRYLDISKILEFFLIRTSGFFVYFHASERSCQWQVL